MHGVADETRVESNAQQLVPWQIERGKYGRTYLPPSAQTVF